MSGHADVRMPADGIRRSWQDLDIRCKAFVCSLQDLLLPDRAARPLHPEVGGTFPEATVQALTQVLKGSRY